MHQLCVYLRQVQAYMKATTARPVSLEPSHIPEIIRFSLIYQISAVRLCHGGSNRLKKAMQIQHQQQCTNQEYPNFLTRCAYRKRHLVCINGANATRVSVNILQ